MRAWGLGLGAWGAWACLPHASSLKPQALAAVLIAVGLHPLQGRQAATNPAYTLVPAPSGVELKTPDGRTVFQYLTKKPDDVGLTSPSAACFHPVNTPSGERVTNLAPDDHPHHRGMYLAWHDAEFRQPIAPPRTATASAFGWSITKADFWGWGQYAPRDGRVIQNRDVKLASADRAQARLEIHNDWNVGTRKMLDETTSVVVAERDGVYVIDLEFRLAPLVDYQLNRQSFSGFNVQARKDGDSRYTNSGGVVTLRDAHYSTPDLNWPPAPWYGYQITLANGRTVGAAVLDHPSNPPSTWHQSRGLWMLNPNIAAIAPLTIRAGVPLALRYRVVVHDGPTPTALVDTLSDEWRVMK